MKYMLLKKMILLLIKKKINLKSIANLQYSHQCNKTVLVGWLQIKNDIKNVIYCLGMYRFLLIIVRY